MGMGVVFSLRCWSLSGEIVVLAVSLWVSWCLILRGKELVLCKFQLGKLLLCLNGVALSWIAESIWVGCLVFWFSGLCLSPRLGCRVRMKELDQDLELLVEGHSGVLVWHSCVEELFLWNIFISMGLFWPDWKLRLWNAKVQVYGFQGQHLKCARVILKW
ncbi:hypothetical protein V6N11_031403 [Hibiscus sabdariffa]|uniref:Transmembrane protein n=1 Tax=Hibiscus sabdariffa TaxID=183260 RepID=A0ABR2SYC1_9ROSI